MASKDAFGSGCLKRTWKRAKRANKLRGWAVIDDVPNMSRRGALWAGERLARLGGVIVDSNGLASRAAQQPYR